MPGGTSLHDCHQRGREGEDRAGLDPSQEPAKRDRLVPHLHDQCQYTLICIHVLYSIFYLVKSRVGCILPYLGLDTSLLTHMQIPTHNNVWFNGYSRGVHTVCLCVGHGMSALTVTCRRFHFSQEILRDFAMSVAQVSTTSLQDE